MVSYIERLESERGNLYEQLDESGRMTLTACSVPEKLVIKSKI